MTFEIALVFGIIGLLVLLFAFDVFPMDKIAFCLIGTLILSNLVTPEEGISGFSNSAVITILCLMIIAAALEQNGVISWMANGLKKFKSWPLLLIIPAFMFISASVSAFISSTAVVIVFIKILTELSDKYNIPKNKLLLPISFASILGGSCTLMGTSTNLIVNSIYLSRTEERLTFFEFSWLGVIFLLAAIVVITIFSKFLPRDSEEKLRDQYDLENYITTLEILPDSKLIGRKVLDTFLKKEDSITLLKFSRGSSESNLLGRNTILQAGDRLTLSCDLDNLLMLKNDEGFIISSDDTEVGAITRYEFKDSRESDKESEDENKKTNNILVELMMLPRARFLGKTLRELQAIMIHNAIPIAIKKRKNLRFLRDRIYKYNLDVTKLKVGDRVLVEMDRDKIRQFDLYDNIAVLQQYESPEIARSKKRKLTLSILFGVIVLAASGLLSILTSAVVGCMILLLSNCIELENVYKKVNWQIIFLLAGMIPLGLAMHNTGADDWISGHLLDMMYGESSFFTIGLLFLATMLLSSVVSNNATAIIMAPIAISLAAGMQLPVKPFVLAVMFAANFSFFTPMGYQTNALIYSMGIYKFKHFMLIGGILSIILCVLATLLLNTMV